MTSLILASLLWALSFGLIKDRLAALDPGAVAALRLALAALVFAPWLRGAPAGGRARLELGLLGVLQFGLMYVLYIASYAHLPAYAVAVFTVGTPVFVALCDGLLARRLRPRVWAVALLAVLGAAAVSWRALPEGAALRGFLLVQGANLCFAAGQVLYRRRAGRGDDAAKLAWMYLGAALFASAAAAARGALVPAGWDRGALLAVLYLGVLPTGAGFWLWNRGAARTGVGVTAALNNLKIPLAVAAAWLVFGERADPLRTGTALVLVVAATLLAGDGRRSVSKSRL